MDHQKYYQDAVYAEERGSSMRKKLRCHINRMIAMMDRQQGRIHWNEERGRYDVFPAIAPVTQRSDREVMSELAVRFREVEMPASDLKAGHA